MGQKMRGRLRGAILGLLLLLPLVLACGILTDATPTNTVATTAESMIVPTPATTATAPTAATTIESAQDTSREDRPTSPASATFEASPSPTMSPTAENEQAGPAGPFLNDLSINSDGILLLPVPALYSGDLVTIQVSPNLPRGLAPNDVQVRVLLDGEELLLGRVDYPKLSGDFVGLYQWAWDTTDQAGTHIITVELDPQDRLQIHDENPDNNEASLEVTVRPRDLLPANQANASWVEVESDCCRLHAVTGTAAHRDIEQLKERVDAAFEKAARLLTTPLSNEPYDIYLIDRIIGQGGYSSQDMVVSYLDRDYVGGGFDELLVHEAVHLIDRQFAPNRITFLAEGLAVWVAGGHYQPHNIGQRMAALIEADGYVPIDQIIENFYEIQHEVGYLESASLVEYLIDTYGWPRVRDFYANASADDGVTLIDAIDVNLREAFGRTLDQIEADWLAYLAALPRDTTAVEDLQTTLRYYDVMRRYQTIYDPTAYYLHAWLPMPADAAERQATADFSRHPETETNLALEAMFLEANTLLWQDEYDRANAMLDSIDRILMNDGQFLDPLARSYLNIVKAVAEEGYEVQQIDLNGNRATVTASRLNRPTKSQLELRLDRDRTWSLIP